jgi:dTDP-4-amino-4,6-dideoxygalactose transaminase
MIPLFKVHMSSSVPEASTKVLMSGNVTQGPYVEIFEEQLSEFLDNEFVLTLNSATAGLTLALRLLMKPNEELNWNGFDVSTDQVLSCPLTCFATNASILANGAKIKWVDVDTSTANMSMVDLKSKITERTKVIYLVHWGGNATDIIEMDAIKEYTFNKFGFRPMFIEDCAHSFAGNYPSGAKIGSKNGNIQVFSLQAIKLLTTCDGGLITLPNVSLYERAKLLRWYGIDRQKRNYKGKDLRLEHDITDYGYKFHMNDVNASIGIENLKDIPNLLALNRKNGMYYTEQLRGILGVKILKISAGSSFWLYTLRIKRKEEFIEFMKELGIMVSQVHQRNDIFSCLDEFNCHLPNIDSLEKDIVCIPVGWWVSTKQLKYIVDCIKIFTTV